jgi:hypothetical protein
VETQSLGKPAARYPAAVATDSDLAIAVDRQVTTLAVPLDSVSTTMAVTNASSIVAYNLLSIDAEIVKVTAAPTGNAVSIQRGFDGTTPATHLASAMVWGFIDAWHHNALVAEIEAIEQTLGPNLSRVPASPFVISTNYIFSAQTPGGSLIAGNNSITLAPVPQGVNGTDSNHYLYVSGGTGAPEAVLITGGSAVAGAASGTLIISAGHAHSGAWTIQTATAGIQEASIFAGASRQVFIPAGSHHLQAPVTFLSGQSVTGSGSFSTIVIQDFTSGNAFNVSNAAIIRGLEFSSSVTITSGWYLKYVGGAGTIDDVQMNTGVGGMLLDAMTQGKLSNLWIYSMTTGVQVGGPTGASGPTITNVQFADCVTSILCVSGQMELSNFQIQSRVVAGSAGILFNANNPAGFGSTQISNGIIDSAAIGIEMAGTGAFPSLEFHNLYIDAGAGGANFAMYLASTGPSATGLLLNNIEVYGYGGLQAIYISGYKNVSLIGVTVADALAANSTALRLTDVVGAIVSACQLGIVSSTGLIDTANVSTGIQFLGATDRVYLESNVIGGSNPISNGATFTSAISVGNSGLSDTVPTLASAATLAFPWMDNGQQIVVTGTATVSAVAGLRKGQSGYLVTAGAVPFTAGASIGNTLTTPAGGLTTFSFDGTKIWLK